MLSGTFSEGTTLGFRVKLMGYKGPKRDLLDKKLVSVECINGNHLLPMLHVHEHILNEL